MKRRQALRQLGAAAAMFGVAADSARAARLPDAKLRDKDPDRYWRQIREEQFLLAGWRAFLNNGSLGVAAKPVVEAVADSLARAASLVSDEYPRWGYERLDAERTELAAFLGCTRDELALTHNATEAMSFIAAGIDLKAGDEVVLTDLEHPSGRSPWQIRAARHGIALREVKLPLPPKSPEQLVDVMASTIGPRTRVLSFSGIMSPTGLVMPVREICRAARAKGVITVVDGAHMAGQMPLNLHELECDYFAGSPHKWLFTPAGCGFLYGRPEMMERLWPTIATGGWDNKELAAARFMMVGTNNRAIIDGLMAGLRFHQALGSEAVFTRIHRLAKSVREKAAQRRYVELLTPDDDRLYAALVCFRVPGKPVQPLLEACRKKRIWILQSERLRISTHVHTRPEDIGAFFRVMDEVYG